LEKYGEIEGQFGQLNSRLHELHVLLSFSRLFYLAVELEDDVDVTCAAAAVVE
jgi:hypothetical protein